jgi:hypothetical protein
MGIGLRTAMSTALLHAMIFASINFARERLVLWLSLSHFDETTNVAKKNCMTMPEYYCTQVFIKQVLRRYPFRITNLVAVLEQDQS